MCFDQDCFLFRLCGVTWVATCLNWLTTPCVNKRRRFSEGPHRRECVWKVTVSIFARNILTRDATSSQNMKLLAKLTCEVSMVTKNCPEHFLHAEFRPRLKLQERGYGQNFGKQTGRGLGRTRCLPAIRARRIFKPLLISKSFLWCCIWGPSSTAKKTFWPGSCWVHRLVVPGFRQGDPCQKKERREEEQRKQMEIWSYWVKPRVQRWENMKFWVRWPQQTMESLGGLSDITISRGTTEADPGFWSGGPSRVLTPGWPWAQNFLKIGFSPF